MPDAGFCASSFVVLRKGTKILAGIPRNHRKWRNEWAPNWLVYTKESLEDEYRFWRLPASYLYEGENPDDTARRVLKDQLRIRDGKLGPLSHYAFHDPSSWYPGRRHYDLCFVYEARGSLPKTIPEWWERLDFIDLKVLRKMDLGSSMGDLMKVLRLSPYARRPGLR